MPGLLDWSTGIYNPRVDVTKETTTLTAVARSKPQHDARLVMEGKAKVLLENVI